MKSNFDTDVLIVGAGPTGLALGNALSRLGTAFLLVEAKEGTSIHTKATNLMPGTLEQLDVLGLSDAMYARGGVMERYMVHMYGTNVGPRAMHLGESPHPNVLFLGQDLIDRTLKEGLPEAGAEILFSHRLVNLQQDAESVTAVVETNGAQKTIRARYVVGCDGPRSVVRAHSACDFEPVRTGKYVWQADAKLSWRGLKTMKQMWLYYYPEGFGAVIHLPGDLTKVMVFEEKGRLPERLPELSEIEQHLRRMSGDETATLTDPVWLSHGELLTGVAPSLIDRRIILAGDACNPILPNGGQGLNVGIQDSLNLAWKLHDILKGYASPKLLDTYSTERRANRLALESVQINTLKNTLPAPRHNQWFFRNCGNWFLDKFWPFLAKAFSQLGVNYAKSPMSLDKLRKKGVRAGHRVMDADVQRAEDGAEVSLFKLMCAPRWKMIVFDGGQALPALDYLGPNSFPWIAKSVVASHPDTEAQSGGLLHDLDQLAHKVYGVTRPTVLLIRPDNYIAARLPTSDASGLNKYLANWYPGA